MEWLNDIFQRHISALEAELLETARVTFGPPPNPHFFNPRALSSRLGAMADSRDSSRNNRTGFLGQLKGDEPAPKKIWEAIQTLFAAMNEVQENVASRFGSKTKVAFTTSPGYASMPPALQFVYAILILIAEGNGWRILMAAPNRELEPTNLRLRRSELAAAWRMCPTR